MPTIEQSHKVLNDNKSGKYSLTEAARIREIINTIIQIERNNAMNHYEKELSEKQADGNLSEEF